MGHGLELLSDPVAERLLASTNPARLAYSWTDGTPRVVPIWFHWDGIRVYFGTPPSAPKIKALQADPSVAVTIDSNAFPWDVLMIRGEVTVEILPDVGPEYVAAAERYFGPEAAATWVSQMRGRPMARIALTPESVRVLDFQTRFPSAMSA
ncbi:pyridoxamine 5'-phosphate oxidase family protein [Microlunatus ginsengisoli]|uniref:Pyridoxamine 5'-phosphate oxidase N-terminal domain-containing protein n=1 Tax=Microlunatus ginsengisoli TaxID=363863 RepID=A0ABP7ATU5_9ACTN